MDIGAMITSRISDMGGQRRARTPSWGCPVGWEGDLEMKIADKNTAAVVILILSWYAGHRRGCPSLGWPHHSGQVRKLIMTGYNRFITSATRSLGDEILEERLSAQVRKLNFCELSPMCFSAFWSFQKVDSEKFVHLWNTSWDICIFWCLQATNQPCMLVYTSGTTGRPKGVMMSQVLPWFLLRYSFWSNIFRILQDFLSGEYIHYRTISPGLWGQRKRLTIGTGTQRRWYWTHNWTYCDQHLKYASISDLFSPRE